MIPLSATYSEEIRHPSIMLVLLFLQLSAVVRTLNKFECLIKFTQLLWILHFVCQR